MGSAAGTAGGTHVPWGPEHPSGMAGSQGSPEGLAPARCSI